MEREKWEDGRWRRGKDSNYVITETKTERPPQCTQLHIQSQVCLLY